MRRIILGFYTLTASIWFCDQHAVAQNSQPGTGIKNPSSPTFNPYSAVSPNPNRINTWNNPLPLSPTGIQKNQQEQFQKTNQELLRQQRQSTHIKEELHQKELEYREREYLRKTQLYKDAYAQLIEMNNDSFSITKAVYVVENAFYENKFDFSTFLKSVQAKAAICRQIIQSEKLNSNDNLAKNYAIQKLFAGGAKLYDNRTKTFQPVKPFLYDFEDYRGEKDWTKMFVTKLLLTGKGQCHSMPELYMIVAEQLEAQAWLSTAPEHSYIKFPGNNGNVYNFETTQGKNVSDQAIVMSGYVTPAAIKSKVYMDTLSRQQLLAQMLIDLVQGYREKLKGYDEFTEHVVNQILIIDPNNIMALMMKADIIWFQFEYEVNKVGRPPVEKLPLYPKAYQLFQQLKELHDRVDNSGHQAMPPEAYEQWLQSLKQKKYEQENKELQDQIKRTLKLPKPTLINKKD